MMLQTQTKAWLAFIATSAIWGFFPLFVRLMQEMSATELLYVRIIFSLLILLFFYAYKRRIASTLALIGSRPILIRLMITALLLALNWLVYIVAINKNLTSQASMGYFITPLINVALGVYLFQEKIDKWKMLALGLACVAVLYQIVLLGEFPWLALAIGVSFGFYGTLRKKIQLSPVAGLFAEMLILSPFALLAWLWLGLTGQAFEYRAYPMMIVYCIGAGAMTLVPLLLYLYAVKHLPLSTIAMAQYASPTLQFLLAIFYFHEPFDWTKLISFLLIWTGLGIYSLRLIYQYRRTSV